MRCVHKPALTLSTLMKAQLLKVGQCALSYFVNEQVKYRVCQKWVKEQKCSN